MKISIAMATYNGMKYLKEQLESLVQQTRLPDEIVIVDDCSTDATYHFICTFSEKYPDIEWKISRNDKNVGFIKNFRKAISFCNGDLIFLADQDDVWLPEKIKKMEQILENNKTINVLGTSLRFIDRNGNENGRKYVPYNKKDVARGEICEIPWSNILEKNFFPGCTLAIRRKIAQMYLEMDEMNIPHDWLICLIASTINGLFWINRSLIKYRIHENNTLGLEQAKGNMFSYIRYQINNWRDYLSGLFVRAEVLAQLDYSNLYKKDIEWIRKRYFSINNGLLCTYVVNMLSWFRTDGKYDKRGIVLDLLLCIGCYRKKVGK